MAGLVTQGQSRVLITGASGFIGRHCLAPLLAKFDQVHSAGRNSRTLTGLLGEAQSKRVVQHEADLKDAQQAARLVETLAPTHLLHLAWTTETGFCLTDPDNELWYQSSMAMVDAFHRAGGRRIVVSGTCAEYDWSFERLSENSTPLKPNNLYGQTKNKLRDELLKYAQDKNLSAAWARIFFVFGPGEDKRRLVASVITSILANQEAECTHGEQRRDYLYVQDVADALVSILLSDVEGPVNIGSGNAIRLKDLIEAAAAKLNGQKLVKLGARKAPPDDPTCLEADITRLATEVGFTRATSLDQALDQTIEWWRKEAVVSPTKQ